MNDSGPIDYVALLAKADRRRPVPSERIWSRIYFIWPRTSGRQKRRAFKAKSCIATITAKLQLISRSSLR